MSPTATLIGAALSTAATSFTDAAGASFTDAADASFTDYADASYTDYGATGTELGGNIMSTFTNNAAYQASTETPWPPPPGITANFNAPNVNGTGYIVVTVFGLVFATILTLMRLYTKAFIKRRLGWEDYTCAASLVGLFAWSGVTIQMALLYLGKHDWNVIGSVARKEWYYKLEFISNTVYLFVLCFVKVSILLLYIRTFHICGPKFRATLWSILVLIVVTHAAGIPVLWLNVTPLNCQWTYLDTDDEVYNTFCHNRYDNWFYFVFISSLTVVLDIIIIVLPSREVWRLQMVKRQKIALVMVFMAGIIVTIASVLRVVFFVRRFYIDTYYDNEFTEFQVDMASTIELDLALICASIPTLQTFIQRFAPSLLNLSTPKQNPDQDLSPNQAEFMNRFNNWPRSHGLVSLSDHGTSVTAHPERQPHSRIEKSMDQSYSEFSDDGKNHQMYDISSQLTNSPTLHSRSPKRLG